MSRSRNSGVDFRGFRFFACRSNHNSAIVRLNKTPSSSSQPGFHLLFLEAHCRSSKYSVEILLAIRSRLQYTPASQPSPLSYPAIPYSISRIWRYLCLLHLMKIHHGLYGLQYLDYSRYPRRHVGRLKVLCRPPRAHRQLSHHLCSWYTTNCLRRA
jgi:hypothetical protein